MKTIYTETSLPPATFFSYSSNGKRSLFDIHDVHLAEAKQYLTERSLDDNGKFTLKLVDPDTAEVVAKSEGFDMENCVLTYVNAGKLIEFHLASCSSGQGSPAELALLLESVFVLNTNSDELSMKLITDDYRICKYVRFAGYIEPAYREQDDIFMLFKDGNLLATIILMDGGFIPDSKDRHILTMMINDRRFNDLDIFRTTDEGYVVKYDAPYIIPQSVNGIIPFDIGKREYHE